MLDGMQNGLLEELDKSIPMGAHEWNATTGFLGFGYAVSTTLLYTSRHLLRKYAKQEKWKDFAESPYLRGTVFTATLALKLCWEFYWIAEGRIPLEEPHITYTTEQLLATIGGDAVGSFTNFPTWLREKVSSKLYNKVDNK